MEKNTSWRIVIVVQCWLFMLGVYAAQAAIPYRHVRVLEGIDKQHVMFSTAAKDPIGMIWMVSGGEVYRYDGVNVVPFAKLYPAKLPFDEIQDLEIDPWGRIWMNSRNGMLVFDIYSWSFCYNNAFVRGLTKQKALAFCRTSNAFFIATEKGEVWQINENRREFLFSFDAERGLGRHPVGRVFVADSEALWLAFNHKLYHYDRQAEKRRLHAIPAPIFGFLEDLLPISGGVLLRSYKKGYYSFDGKTFRLTDLQSDNEDDFTNWNHWSFEDGQRIRVFHKDGQYFEYSRDLSLQLLKKGTHRLAEGILYKRLNGWKRAGDEWLLATDQGLYGVFPADLSFDFLDVGSARGMIKHQGRYYIGGYGYLDILEANGAMKTFLEAPEKNYYAMMTLNKDTVFIAIEGDFLGYLLGGKMSLAQYKVDKSYRAKFSTMSYCLTSYRKDTLLVGTANGLWKYARSSGTVSPYLDSEGHLLADGMRVLSVRFQNNKLTFTSEDGYFTYAGKTVNKTYPADRSKLMIYDHVICEGKTYLATKGRGLVLLDGKEIKAYGVKQGFASNIVYQLCNLNGTIFAGTHTGLSVKRGTQIYNYHIADGLPFEEFNHQAIFFDKETNRLYMGGTGGYMAFDPYVLLAAAQKYFTPKPTVSAIHIGMQSNQFQHVYAATSLRDTILLARQTVMFTMDFAKPDYYRQGYDIFYKIEPLMDGFQEMPSSYQINLSGMTAGEYKVFIKVQPSNTAQVQTWKWLIRKQPVFMETQGFYILVLLGVSGLTAYILYERARRIKNEKILRRQISIDLHDEVGGMLTGISMQADLLMFSGQENARDSVFSIAQFSREAMQMMDDIIWSIDARNNYQGSLEDRIKFLAFNMLEPLGTQITFEVNIEYEKRLPQVIRQNVYLLFKEMLHNICKHAAPEKVYIQLGVKSGYLTLEVSNDGLIEQRKTHKLRKGQGTKNMEIRAKQVGGNVVKCQENGMYVVKVTVPLKKSTGLKWKKRLS
ncbi:sensor histidine kinase [Sphingobacterium sp. LRF_L2]|uniref:sensor histidine kinase n=1 Tax=Sphingobacterium sp. LRF_L2 TaxID=3369421 RepID=UPI003F600FFD